MSIGKWIGLINIVKEIVAAIARAHEAGQNGISKAEIDEAVSRADAAENSLDEVVEGLKHE
jgi:hypothetical protein